MKYIVSETQLNRLNNNLLSEAPREIEGCHKFKDKRLLEFCRAVEKTVSENLTDYSSKMESLLMKYFEQDDRIKTIEMEKLNEESPIVVEGFKEIDEVVKLLSQNCPSSKVVAEKLKKKWLSEYNVYYKDENGNYHLINRLDTNYTAISVLITLYYSPLVEQVRRWVTDKKLPSSDFVTNWIDHFFNPEILLIDPRTGLQGSPFEEYEGPLKKLYSPYKIFNKVLKPKDFIIEDGEFHKEMMETLEEVRKKGFKTEDYFEKLLKDNNIEYKRYSYDYSFVDMVLGIDFLIKEKFQGKTNWVPVQVKSTFKEKYSLVDRFNCDIVIKPELIKIDGKEDFKIGDIRGFKNYFCRNHGFCKVSPQTEKKKVYAPSSVDYFSSKEYEDTNGI